MALTRGATWAFAVGLAACAAPPSFLHGVPTSMSGGLWVCERLAAPERDWCAVAALPHDGGGGRLGLSVCAKMSIGLARDRCVLSMVGHEIDPAPVATCGAVGNAALRTTCVEDGANRLASTDLAAAAEACAEAGPKVGRCVVRALDTRLAEGEDPGALLVEIEAIRPILPRLQIDPEFGTSVGRLGRELGYRPGLPGPCDVLGTGPAGGACVTGLAADNAE